MEQKILFRQLLREILETAAAKGNTLSVKEVDDFFAHAGLNDEQMEMIYSYLKEQKVRLTGTEADEEETDGGGGMPGSLALYLAEIGALEEDGTEDDGREEFALFERAAAGDAQAAGILAQRYLSSVVEMAAQYPVTESRPEDLIGDGNLALVSALASLEPQESLAAYRRVLLSAVGSAMEESAGAQSDLDSMGKGLVSKVTHLDQAIRNLEEDLGHKVSVEELSAYLEMPVEEIRDILRMAGDQIDLQ